MAIATLPIFFAVGAAPQVDTSIVTIDPEIFFADYRTREALALTCFTIHGTIQRPAIAMEAAGKLELATYEATCQQTLADTLLRWELVTWETPSYQESKAAVASIAPDLPDEPAIIPRISVQSIHSDVVSVRICSKYGIRETIEPGGAVSLSTQVDAISYEVHDAGTDSALHILEKVLKSAGVGYARLLKRVNSLESSPDGMLTVSATGALSNMSEALGSWSLSLEQIGSHYVVRSASYSRKGAQTPSWSVITTGVVEGAPFPVAQVGTIRYFSSNGSLIAEYTITIDSISPQFDGTLKTQVLVEHAERVNAGVLDTWDYRGGSSQNTVTRNGVPDPVSE